MFRLLRHPVFHLACGVLLASAFVAIQRGDDAVAGPPKANGKKKSSFEYVGVEGCKKCHSGAGYEKDTLNFCLMNEYDTWYEKDKHSQAFKVLSNGRSQRMGLLLWGDNAAPTKKSECLTCHALESDATNESKFFHQKNGVSCEGCHGPGREWLGPHILASWRLKSSDDKQRLGMIDVRDPVKRAGMCVSCHVGNLAQGKFVTHEMYAAGHPPLGAFEITTFSEHLPKHWRARKDVPFIQDPVANSSQDLLRALGALGDEDNFKARVHKLYRFETAAHEPMQLALIGNLVALQASMALLAGIAGDDKDAKKLDIGWPELSMFDCYACHHELKRDSWQRRRGFAGPPGRPPLRPWPFALSRPSMRLAHGNDTAKLAAATSELDAHLKELGKIMNSRPFGDAARTATAARQLANLVKLLVADAAKTPPDRLMALHALHDICGLPSGAYPDYDSARQLAWTFDALRKEAGPKLAADPMTKNAFADLDRDLRLKIPIGKYDIEVELPSALKHINAYDPATSVKSFHILKARLDALAPRQRSGK